MDQNNRERKRILGNKNEAGENAPEIAHEPLVSLAFWASVGGARGQFDLIRGESLPGNRPDIWPQDDVWIKVTICIFLNLFMPGKCRPTVCDPGVRRKWNIQQRREREKRCKKKRVNATGHDHGNRSPKCCAIYFD